MFRCGCHGVWRFVASIQSEVFFPIFGWASFWTCDFSTFPVQTLGLRNFTETAECLDDLETRSAVAAGLMWLKIYYF